MGNYLQSLRAPPQTPAEAEHERHHPLHYDWSLPKWSPFRDVAYPARRATLTSESSRGLQGSNLQAAESATDLKASKANKTQPPARGKLAVVANSAIKSAKETIRKSLKSTLTNDRADRRTSQEAADKSKTSGGGGGKSTGSGGNYKQTKEAAHAASSMRKSSDARQATATTTTTIKKVDSTRPQTIDPARNGAIDDQAALKAATNIHTVAAKNS